MPDDGLVDDSPSVIALDAAVGRAQAALLKRQRGDGHWVFELEADATIPAEYVLLEHYVDRIEPELQRRIGNYLRATQGTHGGWPLFHDGAFNISATVKAYFALKLIGDDVNAPHMRRAREAVLAAGGAERSNVFTRAQLALFGEVPWRAVPVMPVELVLLPRWFPFHLDKVSYWSRTVVVPLTVLMALRPQARNPRGVHVAELFATPPEQVRDWIRGPFRSGWGRFLQAARQRAAGGRTGVSTPVAAPGDRLGGGLRHRAAERRGRAGRHLSGDGQHRDDVRRAGLPVRPPARRHRLGVRAQAAGGRGGPRLLPALPVAGLGYSPGRARHRGGGQRRRCIRRAGGDWLRGKQVFDVVGDWAASRPDAAPGGWAFQYDNPHYPDVDDTAVVGMLLHRQGGPEHAEAIARARDWIVGDAVARRRLGRVRCRQRQDVSEPHPVRRSWRAARPADRGRDGTLRLVPGADRHAGRCPRAGARAGLAAARAGAGRQLVRPLGHQLHLWHLVRAVRAERGRGSAGGSGGAAVRSAFLLETQRPDGGWGEDNESYADAPHGRHTTSTPSQTAWALLGLMAAGRGGASGGRARHRVAGVAGRKMMANGTRRRTRRSVFRASSTCATTATGCSFRCWRWRATAT